MIGFEARSHHCGGQKWTESWDVGPSCNLCLSNTAGIWGCLQLCTSQKKSRLVGLVGLVGLKIERFERLTRNRKCGDDALCQAVVSDASSRRRVNTVKTRDEGPFWQQQGQEKDAKDSDV